MLQDALRKLVTLSYLIVVKTKFEFWILLLQLRDIQCVRNSQELNYTWKPKLFISANAKEVM